MSLFLVLPSALMDSKRREETGAIKAMLRIPARECRANEEGIKRKQPQISAQTPVSDLPFLVLGACSLFSSDWEQWWGGWAAAQGMLDAEIATTAVSSGGLCCDGLC